MATDIKEIVEISANIATPLGALGLLLALMFFAYYRYFKNEENKLQLLPESEREKSIDLWLKKLDLKIDSLDAEQKTRIVCREIDRKANFAKLLIIAPSSVFVICFIVASYVFVSSNMSKSPIISGDLTEYFGKNEQGYRVHHVPRNENTKLLSGWFSKSQKSIKIFAANGSSWLMPDHKEQLNSASKRVSVTILLIDGSHEDALATWNDAMTEYGESVLTKNEFMQYVKWYSQFMTNENKFTLGLHREYPWTRFTIFDDRAVSFIITPGVVGGNRAITYFSENKYVVDSFMKLFEKIKNDSTIFKNGKEIESFLQNQPM